MATTTNYGWTLPLVGGDSGAWGTVNNNAIIAIDARIKLVSDIADAALPKAGGVMTGRVDLKGSSIARSDLGSISGTQALDLSVAQYFAATIGGAVTISITNPASGTVAQGIILRLTNPGAFTITWPSSVKWPSGSAPALTASGVDVIVLLSDDNGTTWRAVRAMQDVR
jgi:hypothetical protein